MKSVRIHNRIQYRVRQAECAVLFFILPLALYELRHILAFNVVPILICLGVAGYVYLGQARQFDRKILSRMSGMSPYFKSMGMVFIVLLPLFLIFTWLTIPEHFFRFPRSRPGIWTVVMLLYPLLAALPQEIIFRCVFFHRYRDLFPCPWLMIAVNGLSFGLFHLFYANWFAPVLSGLGGCLFAWRYTRSQSLPVVAIEHGIWGNLLFTMGLGWYFYSGSIQ